MKRRERDAHAAAEPVDPEIAAPSAPFLTWAGRSRRELEQAFLRGHTPEPADLAGWEFRGLNTTRLAWLGGIKKFVKGFEWQDESGTAGQLRGYNRPVRQNRVRGPWRPGDKRFGWYQVARVDPTAPDNAYLHALLLDYGKGGNPTWDPSARLRDYLIQPDPVDPTLYLGKAYYALGRTRVPLSFFVIERLRRAP
jgi:hypothetical protein